MKLVVPIMPTDLADLDQLDEELLGQADLIEWRADVLPQAGILPMAAAVFSRFPAEKVIFTIRTVAEGGLIDLSDQAYADLLLEVGRTYQPAYIDVEYFSHPGILGKIAELDQLVLSYHDFSQTPADLDQKLAELTAQGQGVVKVAVMPQSVEDVLELMRLTQQFKTAHPDQTYVTMSMGDLGKLSRLAGGLTGSDWSFASLTQSSAPGQLSLADMVRFREVLYGD